MSFQITPSTGLKDFISGLKNLPKLFPDALPPEQIFDIVTNFKNRYGNGDSDPFKALFSIPFEHYIESLTGDGAKDLGAIFSNINTTQELPLLTKLKAIYSNVQSFVEQKRLTAGPLERAELTCFLDFVRDILKKDITKLGEGIGINYQRLRENGVPAENLAAVKKCLNDFNEVLLKGMMEPKAEQLVEAADIFHELHMPQAERIQLYAAAHRQVVSLIKNESDNHELLQKIRQNTRRLEHEEASKSGAIGFQQNFAGITKGEPLGTINIGECMTLYFVAQDNTTLGVHIAKNCDLKNLPALINRLPAGPLKVYAAGAASNDEVAHDMSEAVLNFFKHNPALAARCSFEKANIGMALNAIVFDPKTREGKHAYPHVVNNFIIAEHSADINAPKIIRLAFDSSKSEKAFPFVMNGKLHEKYVPMKLAAPLNA